MWARASTITLVVLLSLSLSAGGAHAGPAVSPDAPDPGASEHDEQAWVIPPGREAAARELLAPIMASTPPPLRWQGPRIEVDRIKWWLMHGEQARAMLVLVPRALAGPDDPRSASFAIQAAWAPTVTPEPHERELVAAAIEAVEAGDRGQFYELRIDALLGDRPQRAPPYVAPTAVDPAELHRRWATKLAGVALLGLFALVVTLRRERGPRSREPRAS